uniref:Uncharacterized protein n=1 Tax=Oryza nivara TaxID=4536 RepID=A0A0E0HYU7_ORYNI
MDGKARRSLQPGGWRPGERPTPVKAASGAPPGIATNSRLSRFRSERQLTSATLWNWRIPVTALNYDFGVAAYSVLTHHTHT